MNAEQLTDLQRRIIEFVREAGERVGALRGVVESIWAMEERLTPEARRKDVSMALAEGRSGIEGILETARGALGMGYADIERTLGKLTEVEPEELAARAVVLGPALRLATERPERLINLYRERHRSRADRLLIEEAASGVIDALGGEDNYEFRDAWNGVLKDVALARGPEELEATSHRSALDGLASYLDSAEKLVRADLALMDPDITDQDRQRIAMARPYDEATVNRYETQGGAHEGGTRDLATEIFGAGGR